MAPLFSYLLLTAFPGTSEASFPLQQPLSSIPMCLSCRAVNIVTPAWRQIKVPCPVYGCDVWATNVDMDEHIRTHLCQVEHTDRLRASLPNMLGVLQSSGEKHLYHMQHHSDLYLDKLKPGCRHTRIYSQSYI